MMSMFGLRQSDLASTILAAKLNALVMGQGDSCTLEYLKKRTQLTDEQVGEMDARCILHLFDDHHIYNDLQIKTLESLLASGGTGLGECGISY